MVQTMMMLLMDLAMAHLLLKAVTGDHDVV
jgi:hypothetical protein